MVPARIPALSRAGVSVDRTALAGKANLIPAGCDVAPEGLAQAAETEAAPEVTPAG